MNNNTIEVPQTIQVPNGYKQTAVGLIPNDWEVERFDNVFELFSTNSFSRDNLTYDKTKNEIQNIHYGDIHSKFKYEILDCETEKLPYIKDELILNQKFNYLNDGDLIITDASEDYEGVGECIEVKNIGKKKIVSGLHTFLARDNSNKTIQGFRNYIFNNPKVSIELKKIATGISVFSISKSELKKLKIPVPSILEQQKIASVLSTWDVAIDNCKVIIEELKARNKGLAQQLLTGKTRVKGFEKAKWVLLPIKKISKDISKKNPNNKDLIVLSCTKYNGLVPSLEYFGRKIYSDDLTTYKIVLKGQFAYATNHIEEGSIGYQSNYDEALISPMYTVFQTDENINDNFLFRVLKSTHYIHEYQKRTEGSIDRRGGLRWDEFSKIKVPVPELKEQFAIVKVLDKATEELNQYQQKLQTLQLQKKGLMQQLLTGKIRV
jgi:type I restriction enzyme S subunit